MATATEEIYWDPFDIEIDTDPYGVWRRLRDEAPLYRNDRYDFWALSRFADVQAAHTDHKTFLSGKGTVLEHMGTDLGDTNMIIFMDPPQHDVLRALVSRAFTPRRVAALEGRIRQICADLLDPQVGGSGFDYVVGFAQQLPSTVISALLGVPDSEREEVRRYIDAVFHIEPGVGMVNDVSVGAQIWLFEYLTQALQERRRRPQDDLFTALTQAEIEDDRGGTRKLTDDEAAAFGNLLVSAGTETVARLLGWAAVTLPAHPDQLAMMAGDRATIPGAVDELLRYEAPSPVQGRWTARDVELHGTVVPKDSKVLLLTGAAGRDERRYPDPDRFDITRDQTSHVSFGFGIHFCLGAALARLEGRIGLEETLARFPEWNVDLDRAVRQHTSTVRGWSSVPITF
ncbi:MAG: cytochrome P450 [Actinomycetota bacterium]|nr:cytochrome P450 [Actinomycetota bacterium]